MHQSIPAAPSPPPPPPPPPRAGLLRTSCRPCQSRGWGICAAWGPGICQPLGHSRALVTHAVSYQKKKITQMISLGKKADWLICHGQEKIEEVVKACS